MGKTTTTSRASRTVLEGVSSLLSEHQREIALLAALLGSTFAMVSLVGYAPTDPTWLHPGDGATTNPCGPLGALLADALFQLLGYGAWTTFGGMVLSVLALAGRKAFDLLKAATLVAWLVALLGMAALLIGPGDAFPPGGLVGRATAAALVAVVGQAGAWLALLGSAGLTATVLFRIRWGALASRAVGAGEVVVPWFGRHAGAAFARVRVLGVAAGFALLRQLGGATRGGGAFAGATLRRMGRSLRRREDDDEAASWTATTGLEELEPEGEDGHAPASQVDHGTAVSRDVAIAEVQWVPTEQPEQGSELLDLFPEMTPRQSTSGGAGSPVDSVVEEPTRPSDSPQHTAEAELEPSEPGIGDDLLPEPSEELPDDDTPEAAPVRTRRPVTGALVHKAAHLDRRVKDDGGAVARGSDGPFQLPKLSLLDPVPPQHAEFDSEGLRLMGVKVEETLASFRVVGQVTDIRVGPVVTTLEFLPEKGITVRKVASLADDLAMALKATSVRIVAPIPGKGVVGIEVPSENRLTVYLRELLAAEEFRDASMALPVVLGKDVEGAPVVVDLVKMPHLLVGGQTGAGKSVGVNGMLMSLLFRKSPDELRLLLVDPKRLEFKPYEDVPHLLHPVVTDPKRAAAALAWACREMDARYELLARWDTRNIEGYNRKVEHESQHWTPEKARHYAPADWPAHVAPPEPEKLPYIVVVIDELADLMLVAKKEVETSIARLTQMARACGIHLVVATQRPSVDVVTGLIKSNLPTRISFKLRTGTDSRTILDQIGAEALLGRGDSLYLPNAGDPMRVHGPFVSDEEVNRVMEFLRGQAEPQYIDGVTADAADGDGEGVDDDELDPMYDEAVQVVRQIGKASTSLVQRHLKIGYNRAARIIEQMEARGVVGPADGARPREVLSG